MRRVQHSPPADLLAAVGRFVDRLDRLELEALRRLVELRSTPLEERSSLVFVAEEFSALEWIASCDARGRPSSASSTREPALTGLGVSGGCSPAIARLYQIDPELAALVPELAPPPEAMQV